MHDEDIHESGLLNEYRTYQKELPVLKPSLTSIEKTTKRFCVQDVALDQT